jgi:hypothetical protein
MTAPRYLNPHPTLTTQTIGGVCSIHVHSCSFVAKALFVALSHSTHYALPVSH